MAFPGETFPVWFQSLPRAPPPANFRTQAMPTHLSAREYEHESCPSCRQPPGEEGPQQRLEHRVVALEHAGSSCVQRSKRGVSRRQRLSGTPARAKVSDTLDLSRPTVWLGAMHLSAPPSLSGLNDPAQTRPLRPAPHVSEVI